MTPAEINRQIARTGTAIVAVNNIAALRDAAHLAAAHMPVRWTFDPGTPASVVDYFAGAGHGAFEGAAIGLGIEAVLALVYPPAAIGYALVGGGVLGAIWGVQRVEQGWRVRVVYSYYGEPLLEVRRAA